MKVDHFVLSAIITMVVVSTSWGDQVTAPPKPASSPLSAINPTTGDAAPVAVYSVIPFDDGSTALPANFEGNDVTAVYVSVQDKFKPKDEFETTPDFQKRIDQAALAPIIGTTTIGDLFAFKLDEGGDVIAAYNADAGILNLNVAWDDLADVEADTRSGERFISREVWVTNGEYQAQNAYGAQFTVQKKDRTDTDLVLSYDNLNEFKVAGASTGDLPSIAVTIKLDPGAAREAMSHLGCLLVCRLRQYGGVYSASEERTFAATADIPTELHSVTQLLYVTGKSLVVYNTETGKILATEDAKGGQTHPTN